MVMVIGATTGLLTLMLILYQYNTIQMKCDDPWKVNCALLGWLVLWSLSSHSSIFHSYGDVTIAGEGLQILTIEQWGIFSVSHALRHGPTIYNGHLRGSVTLTPNAERLGVELSLPVFMT